MKYIALIARIADSNTPEASIAAQAALLAASKKLNQRRIAMGLVSPFTASSEQGVQALFRSAKELWTCIFELESALQPVRLSYGIGIGDITSKINDQAAEGMEGEAFENAAACIESLKADGRRYRLQGLADRDALVRYSLDLVCHQRNSWRENRVDTFLGLLKGDSATQTAAKLSITEQAVYRNIRDGELGTIKGVLQEVSLLINEQLQG